MKPNLAIVLLALFILGTATSLGCETAGSVDIYVDTACSFAAEAGNGP